MGRRAAFLVTGKTGGTVRRDLNRSSQWCLYLVGVFSPTETVSQDQCAGRGFFSAFKGQKGYRPRCLFPHAVIMPSPSLALRDCVSEPGALSSNPVSNSGTVTCNCVWWEGDSLLHTLASLLGLGNISNHNTCLSKFLGRTKWMHLCCAQH